VSAPACTSSSLLFAKGASAVLRVVYVYVYVYVYVLHL